MICIGVRPASAIICISTCSKYPGKRPADRCPCRSRTSRPHRPAASDFFWQFPVRSRIADRRHGLSGPASSASPSHPVSPRGLKNGSSSQAGGFANVNDDISRVRVAAAMPRALLLHRRDDRVVHGFVPNTVQQRIQPALHQPSSHRRSRRCELPTFNPCLCASSMMAADRSIGILRSLPKWSSIQIFTMSTFLSASHRDVLVHLVFVAHLEGHAFHSRRGSRISTFSGEAAIRGVDASRSGTDRRPAARCAAAAADPDRCPC